MLEMKRGRVEEQIQMEIQDLTFLKAALCQFQLEGFPSSLRAFN